MVLRSELLIVKVLRHTKDEEMGWEPPKENCVKLNVDGSIVQPGSQVSYGGLALTLDGVASRWQKFGAYMWRLSLL
ncbi:hypothetical protein HN873_009266, partial [Arachis hypogaea]